MELSPPDYQLEVALLDIGTFMTGQNKEIIDKGYSLAYSHREQLAARLSRPLRAPFLRAIQNFLYRLRRAWQAYQEPLYSPFPVIRELPDTDSRQEH